MHLGLRGETAGNVVGGDDSAANEMIDDVVAAVQARAGMVDLSRGDKARFFKNLENVIFVIVHGAKEPDSIAPKGVPLPASKSLRIAVRLLHGHAFGEITRFIHVSAQFDCEVIR